MKNFIAYLDVLGAKNSSEKEDFDDYLRIISNFQTELLRVIPYIEKGNGRIHFFSDCAFIESKNIHSIIEAIRELRTNLFDSNIFIRGAISEGILGAINGVESESFIKEYYNNETINKHFNSIKKNLDKYKEIIRGTLFFSKDIAKVVFYEEKIKGAAIYIDENIIANIATKENYITRSGYIEDIDNKNFIPIFDIKYQPKLITDSFLSKIFRIYYTSNAYDIKYGRYYLTIIISAINCTNFEKIKYNTVSSEFECAPPIFTKILNLRREFSQLYNSTKGLEFIYLSLINKVYSDIEINNQTTKQFLKEVLLNKKYLNFYRNKLSKIPIFLLSTKAKNLLIKDLNLLTEDEY